MFERYSRASTSPRSALRNDPRRYLPIQGESAHGWRGVFEVVVSTILFTLLLGATGQYGSMMVDVEGQRREERGQELISDMRDAISACSYESLATLGGTWFTESARTDAADFRVDVDVRRAENGRLKIEAVLWDNHTSRELSRLVTYRGHS